MDLKGVIVVEDPGARTRSARSGCRLEAVQHVANRPIAHHVLDVLESAGVQEVVVACSVGSAGEILDCLASFERRGGARLRYAEQRGLLDLPGALRLAAPIVGGAPCIVHVASGLLGEPLAPFLDVLRCDSPDVVLAVHQVPTPEEQLSPATQEILHIAALDPERAPLGMAGVLLFGPDALRHVGGAVWRAGGEVDLTMVAERIAAAGGSLQVRLAEAWRRYAGDPLDLLELNRIALDGLQTDVRRPTNNGNRIEGRVWIHERASVEASVIVGPSVIGADAHIADAYIGPYTSIGAGVRIEGAEIERSIVASGASIMHVGGRLVASVVGSDARVFRDFSLPRALRLRVGDGTEVALC